jgi:hypothetical protein
MGQVEFVFNTTSQTDMGFIPHQPMFGRKPNTPGILKEELPNVQYTYENYIKEFQSRLQLNHGLAKKNLIAKKDCSKEYHKNDNISLFTVGDKGLLYDEKVRRGRLLKLSPLQSSPYFVTDIDDKNITLKLLKNRTLKVHAIRQEPMVLEIRVAGKLILNNMRKAYRTMSSFKPR